MSKVLVIYFSDRKTSAISAEVLNRERFKSSVTEKELENWAHKLEI